MHGVWSHMKKPGIVSLTCGPSTGEWEQGGGKGEGTHPEPSLLSLEVAILRPSVKLSKASYNLQPGRPQT